MSPKACKASLSLTTVIFHVCQVFSPQTSSRVGRILDQYCVRFVFLCTPFLTSFCHFPFSCFGLLARDECHPLFRRLTEFCAGAEHTRYSGEGSTSKRSYKRQQSDRIRQLDVWGPLRHCKACKSSHMFCKNAASHL